MKHLRKSILTLLALTLFGGAGAWAQQGPTQVTQITTDLIASWQTDNSALTLADMQALGFVAVDEIVAAAWTGAPLGEFVVLIYGFDGTYFNYITFDNGNAGTPSQTGYTKRGFYGNVAPNGGDVKHFLTSAPAAIELTKKDANQWSLDHTPDYDLELQVEYYEAHALKNIPAGWTVMVNGVPQTQPYQGDSLLITETDTVTLVPPAELKNAIKSVTLEDEGPAVQTITVDGLQLNYVEGENWVQTAERNPEIDISGVYVFKYSTYVLVVAGQPVSPTDTYNSSLSNSYHWQEW